MKNEPVVKNQILAILAVLGMFVPSVREAIVEVGGAEGFGAALASVVMFITVLTRSKVSPVKKEE